MGFELGCQILVEKSPNRVILSIPPSPPSPELMSRQPRSDPGFDQIEPMPKSIGRDRALNDVREKPGELRASTNLTITPHSYPLTQLLEIPPIREADLHLPDCLEMPGRRLLHLVSPALDTIEGAFDIDLA